jgi:hypothetical protein
VFGRRTTKEEPAPQLEETVGGKGRPTPSRKEAEAARKKRMTPPRTRKEANALQRERTKEARQRQRTALDGGGSDRDLPARDRGPVRGFVRDWVDSHLTAGQFLLPFMFAMFFLTLLSTVWARALSSTLFLTVIVVLAMDSFRVVRGVKKGLAERFGADEAKGITMYALLRSWQMRKLRLPKPRVSMGDPI